MNMMPALEHGFPLDGAQRRAAPRFLVLDAMRGLAALMVLFRHLPDTRLRSYTSASHLAVDFFFMLSGFVIAYRYGDMLARERAVGGFMRARLARLLPLNVAALAPALLAYALVPGVADNAGPALVALALVAGALFVPLPPGVWVDDAAIFPLNPPVWSLGYELAVNVAFAIALPLLAGRRLGWAIALAAVALVIAGIMADGLDRGVSAAGAPVAAARVSFAFLVGAALHRAWAQGRLARWNRPWLATAMLIGALMLPAGGGDRVLADLVIVLAVFPAVIALATHPITQPRIAAAAALSGRLSYPLYVMHGPLLFAAVATGHALGGGEFSRFGLAGSALLIAVALAVAHLGERWIDAPARRRFGRRRLRL